MTLEDRVRRHRLAILQRAALLGNVTLLYRRRLSCCRERTAPNLSAPPPLERGLN